MVWFYLKSDVFMWKRNVAGVNPFFENRAKIKDLKARSFRAAAVFYDEE